MSGELGYDGQGRPVMRASSRTCAGCCATKPLDEFRAIGNYRMKKCRACESRERRWRKRGRRWDE